MVGLLWWSLVPPADFPFPLLFPLVGYNLTDGSIEYKSGMSKR